MKICFTFFLLMIIASYCLAASTPVAYMLKANGLIELLRGDDRSKALEGTNLVNKDEVESKENSFAVIKFIDGSSNVKLFPNSILTIDSEKDNGVLNKKSTLLVGSILAQVNKKTGIFEVETPNNVISVKGTEFLLEVTISGLTNVSVRKGEVVIRNKQTDSQTSVKEGEKASENESGGFTFSAAGDFDDKSKDGQKTLQIELENADGEKVTIDIDFQER